MAQQHMEWGIVEEGWRKGPWTAEEDRLLVEYVKLHGEGRWNNVARLAGLRRNGKSCRLRWVNYLRPDLKRGRITPHEESVILQLHAVWGNRWSTIARSLPGRTDNEIKNYWRTHFKKRGKPPAQNAEKTRARLLKRQQYLQQQQQQLQHHQEQLNMKKITSLFDDENAHRTLNFAQLRQDTSSPCVPDDQGMYYSMMIGCAGVPDVASDEDVAMWDGLWNLDDHLHGNVTNRATYHHHTIASSFY